MFCDHAQLVDRETRAVFRFLVARAFTDLYRFIIASGLSTLIRGFPYLIDLFGLFFADLDRFLCRIGRLTGFITFRIGRLTGFLGHGFGCYNTTIFGATTRGLCNSISFLPWVLKSYLHA